MMKFCMNILLGLTAFNLNTFPNTKVNISACYTVVEKRRI